MTMKPFEIQSTSLSINGVLIDTSAQGKLVIPGVTKAGTSVAISVEDTQDQTQSWTGNPVVIDGYTYAVYISNQANGLVGWLPASYVVEQLDGEGFIDGISVTDGGANYTGEAVTFSEIMYAAPEGTPIDNSNVSAWIQIPFRVRCGAGEIQSEFGSGGGGTTLETLLTPSQSYTVVSVDTELNRVYVMGDITNDIDSDLSRVYMDYAPPFVIFVPSDWAWNENLNQTWIELSGGEQLNSSYTGSNLFLLQRNGTTQTLVVGRSLSQNSFEYGTVTYIDSSNSGGNITGTGSFSTLPDFLDYIPGTQLHTGQTSDGLFFSGNASNMGPTVSYPVRMNQFIGGSTKVTVTLEMVVNDECSDFGLCIYEAGAGVEPEWNWGTNPTRIAASYDCGTPYIYGMQNANSSESFYTTSGTFKVRFTYDPSLSEDNVVLETLDLQDNVLDVITLSETLNPASTYSIGFAADQDSTNLRTYIKNLTIAVDGGITYADSLRLGSNHVEYTDPITGYTSRLDLTYDFTVDLDNSHANFNGDGTWDIGSNNFNTKILGIDTYAPEPRDIIVRANGKDWVFDRSGRLTFPDGTIQSTAYVPTNINVDGGGASVHYEITENFADGGFASTRHGVADPTYDGLQSNVVPQTYTLNGGGA